MAEQKHAETEKIITTGDVDQRTCIVRSESPFLWIAKGALSEGTRVKGKSLNLLILTEIEFPHPPGFVITSPNYREYLRHLGLEPALSELDESIMACPWPEKTGNVEVPPEIARQLDSIARQIMDGDFPRGFVECLSKYYAKLEERAGGGAPVTVRSGEETLEDRRTSSGAGQNYTAPCAWDLQEVLSELKRVYASPFLDQSADYRIKEYLRSGKDEQLLFSHIEMSIPVQIAVNPEAAGVAYTVDVRRNRRGILVEAVAGHGEGLVSDRITPSSWLFDPLSLELLEINIVPQEEKMQLDRSGLISCPIHVSERLVPCLREETLREIASRAVQGREYFRQNNLADEVNYEFLQDTARGNEMVQVRPLTGMEIPVEEWNPVVTAIRASTDSRYINTSGETGSSGAASGRLLIVRTPESRNPEHENMPLAYRHARENDILLTQTTNIGWTPLFDRLGAIAVERGGVMSHSAQIAREKGIPAIVGSWGLVDNCLTFFSELGVLNQIEEGVWEVPEAAIDAMNRRIFAGTSEIASGPLTQLLDSDAADSVGDYYMQRVEFAHFADSNGTDWTGKPEYPQTRLQFDLYFEAWRRAYEILHLTDLDMPLFVSMAKLSPSSSRERWIGTIRQNSSEVLEEGEYPVAAFETEKLARLGDRIRSKGLSSEDGRSEHEVIRDLFEYHEMRKNAFNRFTACMESLRNAERLSAEEYSRVFDLYSDIISFAHVRAAFRRRVAGPMRNEAFQSLPECMRARIEKLVIMASNGLWTETSHRRDPAYQVLLMELSEFPEVMKNLLKVDPARGFDFLWENCPEFASAFEQYLCEYKIERAQTDHLENDLPRARAIQMLQQDLRERKETTLHPLFTRTSAGFLAELEKLRPMILREDPSFDFDTFAGKMLLAWEIPALVDTERHIQHRYQYLLRNFLLKTEAELVQSGELAPGKSIFDLSPAELLDRLSS